MIFDTEEILGMMCKGWFLHTDITGDEQHLEKNGEYVQYPVSDIAMIKLIVSGNIVLHPDSPRRGFARIYVAKAEEE